MDYNPGGASPDHNSGGGSIHLVCEYCGTGDNYGPDDAEEGFFTCRQCSAIHTSTQATAGDPNDFPATGNISVCRVATQPTPASKLCTPAPFLTSQANPGTSRPVLARGASPRTWRRGSAMCGGCR
uniref:Uncharacterized protein n=1 Tax=Arundo donax TaxID=35708 RepID=A0A0A9AWN5_ARUDO